MTDCRQLATAGCCHHGGAEKADAGQVQSFGGAGVDIRVLQRGTEGSQAASANGKERDSRERKERKEGENRPYL